MAIRPAFGGRGGGAGFRIGPANNIFGTTAGNVQANPLTVTPAANRAAAETVRDAYFTANPSNLATYDADGNEALGIYIYFLDSSENTIIGQTRVNNAWVDQQSFGAVQGLPGSGTDFSNVSDNHIPAIGPGPNKIPFDSGMQILTTGQILAPRNFGVESGSVDFGDLVTLSEVSGFLGIFNRESNAQFALVDSRFTSAGTVQPRIFELSAERSFTIQSSDADTLTPTSYDFNYTTTLTAQTNSITIRAASAVTNFRARISDVVTGVVFKYWPDKATWLAGTGGRDFTAGDAVIDFLQSQLRFATGRQLRIQFAFDSGTLLGDQATGLPYATARLQDAVFTEIAYTRDIGRVLRQQESRSTSLTINAANVANYQPFYMFEFTNENGRPDLVIADNVFDIGDTLIIKHYSQGANPGTGVRYQILNGRIDGESDMILGQDSSIIARKVADNQWRIIASHDQDTTAFREMVQDIVGGMVTGNTETGITVTYDDTLSPEGTGKLNFVLTDTTDDNTLPTPSLHSLTVGIPSRVDLDTNLNVATNINFDVSNHTQLTALQLIVTTGDNEVLTVPTTDGHQTQSVTLSGISTSSSGTVTFQLSGTHAGGTVTSNVVTVNIRNQQAQEFVHFGFIGQAETSANINFATDDISTSGATAGNYRVANIPASGLHRIYFAVPTDFTNISHITQGGFDITNQFAEEASVTIGGQTYRVWLMVSGSAVNQNYNGTILTLGV